MQPPIETSLISETVAAEGYLLGGAGVSTIYRCISTARRRDVIASERRQEVVKESV
jgi:hypothetical protein